MSRLLLPLLLGVLLGACGSAPAPAPTSGAPAPTTLRGCDDGGSGGVLIDGVCL